MKNTKHLILAKGAFLMVLYDNMPRIVVAYITKSQTEKIRIMEKDVYGQENLNGCVEEGSKKVDLEKIQKEQNLKLLTSERWRSMESMWLSPVTRPIQESSSVTVRMRERR